jgi:hypothetical protein
MGLRGGKRVTQYNRENPISPLENSITTLFYGNNFMKTYENYFVNIGFRKRYESGFRFAVNALYEDRIPLHNTTDFTIFKNDADDIKPNFPYVHGLDTVYVPRHQAVIVNVDISFRPGQKYIQLPYSKVPLGSKYPTFSVGYTKGISDILGSDVNFDKWRFTVEDDKNLKLAGTLRYKAGIGGFINNHKLYIQDYQHFRGNEMRKVLGQYLSSFQLLKYYEHSNTGDFYSFANIEHHFNGLITNKIPLFKRLNWNLVAGSNGFYVNEHNNYIDVFAGIENIFKILRIDCITSFEYGKSPLTVVKIGAGGLLGNNINVNGSSSRRRGNSVSLSF